jgi:hypothetical protein
MSDHVTLGKPMLGSPLGTGPRMATPWLERSAAQLTTMAPTTAMSAPGILRSTTRSTTMNPSTPADTATVAQLV